MIIDKVRNWQATWHHWAEKAIVVKASRLIQMIISLAYLLIWLSHLTSKMSSPTLMMRKMKPMRITTSLPRLTFSRATQSRINYTVIWLTRRCGSNLEDVTSAKWALTSQPSTELDKTSREMNMDMIKIAMLLRKHNSSSSGDAAVDTESLFQVTSQWFSSL